MHSLSIHIRIQMEGTIKLFMFVFVHKFLNPPVNMVLKAEGFVFLVQNPSNCYLFPAVEHKESFEYGLEIYCHFALLDISLLRFSPKIFLM